MADYTYQQGESPETTPDLAKKYPLASVNAKIRRTVHTMFGSQPWITEIFPEAWVDIHVDDAAARGIKDGDTVEVLNDRGSIKVKAHVHVGIRPGVVSLQNGWWIQQGGNASMLSNDAFDPMSYGHTLNSTLVQVRALGGNNV
jgi:anaerobic selenocysteine-containing dehydrogenase